MERPKSIVWFERCYLGGIAIGVLNTAANWGSLQAQVAAAPNSMMLPPWFIGATVAIGLGINLLLWYFVARRASVVAKWIVTVFFVLGLSGVALTLARGAVPPTLNIVSAIALVLQAVAVFMLFRPDTRTWFGARD